MEWLNEHILTLVLAAPLLGALFAIVIPSDRVNGLKVFGIGASTVTFLVSVYLFIVFDGSQAEFQFVEKVRWIGALNVSYHVGVDGISLLLVMITTFLTPLSLLASWDSIKHRIKEFVVFMLFLEFGMLGVYLSIDTFLFYVFWEAMLIPMYFIIGIWGGHERIYAAIKFFLYTMFGSLLMLVAIIWLGYFASTQPEGHFTTNLPELLAISPKIPATVQMWMFLAFALSFAIKVPLFPFHTWLPDAHVQAPTAGSVVLAGVLLKMGTYGFVRFCLPLFPIATFEFLPYVAILAVVGIIYGALVSLVQTDLKKLVAYSSVSHLGFVVLGIFAMTEEALQGSLIQMVNHGLSTGALFLIVGMLYDRRHTREISDFGGLSRKMPVFATLFMIVMLSSLGLPGLNGFVGEFLILLGSFKSQFLGTSAYAVAASVGVILTAVYLLWMYRRVMFGPLTRPENEALKDLNTREIVVLLPIVVFIVWIGLYPSTFLDKTSKSVEQIVLRMEQARVGALSTGERDAQQSFTTSSTNPTKVNLVD